MQYNINYIIYNNFNMNIKEMCFVEINKYTVRPKTSEILKKSSDRWFLF